MSKKSEWVKQNTKRQPLHHHHSDKEEFGPGRGLSGKENLWTLAIYSNESESTNHEIRGCGSKVRDQMPGRFI